jgi:hypothetical protein
MPEVKLTGASTKVTLVVEMKSSEDCKWIWNSFRSVILKSPNAFENGVKVLNMREGDCLATLNKLEVEQAKATAKVMTETGGLKPIPKLDIPEDEI